MNPANFEISEPIVQDWLQEWDVDINDPGIDLNVLAIQLYNAELNWNNADPTSGMCVLLESEIYRCLQFIKG